MRSIALLAACIAALVTGPAAWSQSIRVVKFSEGKPFQMGKVTSRRIVHPDLGAKRLTLNYSASDAVHEFSQRVHDHSDETILVLQGAVDLRQGDSQHPIAACAAGFVRRG